MSKIERSALVHYSASEMYDLVNDVNSYSSFLPWCNSSTVISRTETEIIASLGISKGFLNKSFTTRNRLTKNRKMEIELVEGPFKKLTGYWEFESLKTEDACRVLLKLEFEFDNAMMSIAARPIFTQIANSLVDSFCKRAVEVYGERG